MKKIIFSIILIICLGSLSAQTFYKWNGLPATHNSSNDTLKILAVMVDFLEDKYDGTIGNGKFGSHYTQAYGDTILDPLPHDSEYFSDHLEFAKNYFKKVSKGKLNIAYKVLPEVVTVSKTMRDYVPSYNSKDFTPLGNFSKEVWELADQKFTNVDFSKYELFIIFHAGVSSGLDIGIYSIDRNMPSLYLSYQTLKEVFGNSFNGFAVNNGSSLISNSIILPETETREFQAIDDSIVLFELSINGAIVANIASHLGLPDLFNTETGTSAIGRFGLMDAQAIVASNGMFPPEPSPWEKIFLNWEEPVVISPKDTRINIADRISAAINDTTLVKIPINSSEYFLVENRQQDANKDKVKITYKRNGNVYTSLVEPDTNGLFNIDYTSIPGGVVIDVDEFDAAVPGRGIVIWHIDENIINEKLYENRINSDLSKKGVAVVEADGIQDVGVRFSNIFGDFIGEGSYEDFWYKGNPSKLYKNLFSSDTKPNTNSNTGAKSLITLEDFSEIKNKMSFKLSWGSNNYQLIANPKVEIGKSNRLTTVTDYSNANYILLLENSNLYIYDLSGVLIKTINDFSDIQPVSFENNSTEYIVGAKNNKVNIYSKISGVENLKSVLCYGEIKAVSANVQFAIPRLIIGINSSGSFAHVIPIADLINLAALDKNSFQLFSDESPLINLAVESDFYYFLGENSFIEYTNAPSKTQLNGKAKKFILAKGPGSSRVAVILMEDNKFIVYQLGFELNEFYVNSEEPINTFAVADIFNTGNHHIVITNGNKIEAYNLQGVMADNFPFTIQPDEKFIGAPLIADFNYNGYIEIIAFTDKGSIYVIDPVKAKTLAPFPITYGDKHAATPVLIKKPLPVNGPNKIYEPYISLLTDNNDLYIWRLGTLMGKSFWASELGDSYNSSFVDVNAKIDTKLDFFPSDKAYNWPNPVYGTETNIRYYVADNSDVNIKIFDLAGALVAELKDKAVGGFDNETIWNLAGIQSGVYYARIEVKSISGQTANKIIKIAVVK